MKDDRDCQGPGVKMIQQQIAPGFYQQFQQNDPNCVSRGKSWRSNCKSCPKGKTNPEKIDLTIDVTKGMRNGERITFEGVTDEKPGYKAGDLHYVIKEVPHKVFRRDGDHLYMHQEIPLVDALTGFKLELTHLDDSRFSVQVDTVTDCDHVMRVPGKGMPRRGGNGFGDLYITFDVDFPDTLTNEQKTAIRKILTSEVNGEL
jgi:DnaJ-class molecular chaperone